MHRLRRIATWTLLSGLLVGGLMAPVAHLVWMRATEPGDGTTHAMHAAPATLQKSAGHAGHMTNDGGMAHAMAEPGAGAHGPGLHGEKPDAPECPYLSLLTSPSPACAAPSPEIVTTARPIAVVASAVSVQELGFRTTAAARGPPTASADPA